MMAPTSWSSTTIILFAPSLMKLESHSMAVTRVNLSS
jgi:hypothetical protein